MHHVDVVYLGLFVVLYGLVSRRLEGTAITAPMLAVVYGVLLGPFALGLIELDVEGGAIRLLPSSRWPCCSSTTRRASTCGCSVGISASRSGSWVPGLAGTFVLGFGLGMLLLGEAFLGGEGGLGAWQVALVAAMLAPTDAALGQAVVSQESVPQRIRQALNVESGLNDGLVVPLVAICLACAVGGAQEAGAAHWVVHAAKAAGYGVLVGVGGGAVLAMLLDRARAAGWAGEGAVHYAVAAVPVVLFFRRRAGARQRLPRGVRGGPDHGQHDAPPRARGLRVHRGRRRAARSPDVDRVRRRRGAPTPSNAGPPRLSATALLSLTVVRMAPVALALVGTGFSARTTLFLGWFGPRGLATVVFAVGALGESELAGRETIFGVAVWTVLLSVLLHGVTAAALARRYGSFCSVLASQGRGTAEERSVAVHPTARRGG